MHEVDSFIDHVNNVIERETYETGFLWISFEKSNVKKLKIKDDYLHYIVVAGKYKFRILEKNLVRKESTTRYGIEEENYYCTFLCFCEVWNESISRWVSLDI